MIRESMRELGHFFPTQQQKTNPLTNTLGGNTMDNGAGQIHNEWGLLFQTLVTNNYNFINYVAASRKSCGNT